MNEKTSQQAWHHIETRARAELEASVQALPESTQQRLAEARQRALAGASRAENEASYWRPAGFGLAASLLVAGFFWWQASSQNELSGPQVAQPSVAHTPLTQTSEALTPEEGLWVAMELTTLGPASAAVVEDLEFMVWLNEEMAPDV